MVFRRAMCAWIPALLGLTSSWTACLVLERIYGLRDVLIPRAAEQANTSYSGLQKYQHFRGWPHAARLYLPTLRSESNRKLDLLRLGTTLYVSRCRTDNLINMHSSRDTLS